MNKVMKVSEFIAKLKDISENYKTLYIMGCFGAPMNTKNKTRYCNNHEYNRKAARTQMIKESSTDTFGFDCVGLIKSVLWGWNGDCSKTYGGAAYKSNNVSDLSADGMIGVCTNVTSDFSKIEVGEALWCKGHIGVYIGDGLAVECTPAWKNKVQVTAVKNIGTKSGYNSRMWTKHGKLPYLEYDMKTIKPKTNSVTKTPVKVEYASKLDGVLSGRYKVTASSLHIRAGAGTNKASLGTLKKGTVVTNYGYYSLAPNGTKWLYVKTTDGTIGFCSIKYLKKF